MGWLDFRRCVSLATPSLSPRSEQQVALAIALASATLVACDAPREEQAAPPDPRFATLLQTASDFGRLQGEQWAVKYLSRVDGRTPPEPLDQACTFQNTAQFPLHMEFLRTFPGLETLDFQAYLSLVMKRDSRVFWAGELRPFSGVRHPRTGRTGVMGMFVYADGHEPLEADEIVELYRRMEGCIPYARDSLVLVGADTEQAARFSEQAEGLAQVGISVADHADLAPGVAAEAYSVGEGYGYLRIVPPGEELPVNVGPRDLLVIEAASEDIGLVAGLVTALPQNVHSHLNLRLREKAVPNARISSVFDDQALMGLDGRLARVRVEADSAAVEPTTLEEAAAFWMLRVPPIVLPAPNFEEARLLPLGSLVAADATAYGRKAANLGELYRALPEANRVSGFGIPFSRYEGWMRDSGLAERVTALLAEPRTGADAAYRRSALEELRDAIETADVPPDLIAELAATAEQVFGTASKTLPLRFRSSSNVEDGERLSGAGLHDSARGCLADDLDADTSGPSACLSEAEREALEAELERRRAELEEHPERSWLVDVIDDLSSDLTRERPVSRALKKVYASLWNDRAFEERAYFGVAQQLASMGVMVNPSFVLERVDAVAVTNLAETEGGEPYTRLVSQSGGQPVVRPLDPTLAAETITFRASAGGVRDVQLLVPSSLSPSPIWSTAQLTELAQLVALAQEHFEAHVYPDIEPLRLDLEIKVTNDDRIVIKQARPYVSVEP